MLSVPEPEPNDPEGVSTALETAAIFGAQGDVREAVRWVRRAAEIASDEGSDLRALALARAVADLNISSMPPKPPEAAPAAPDTTNGASAAQPPAEPQAAPPPSPPLPAAGARAADDDPDADAETRVVESTQFLRQLAEEEGEPAPSTDPGAAPAVSSAESTPLGLSPLPPLATVPADPPATLAAPVPAAMEPPAAAPAQDEGPASRRRVGSIKELLQQKEAELAPPASTPPPLPDSLGEAGWGSDEAAPGVVPVQAAASPAAAAVAEDTAAARHLHSAVRASIERAPQNGAFILRVLEPGARPAPGTHEAFVVLTDPTADPFGGR